MLVVIGDLIDDVIVIGAHTIERGTDNAAQISHTRGGSAANVAAAAASLVSTRFIGKVGSDATGDALARALGRGGVDVRVQQDGRTGSIVILVDETGERTMLTDRGAAAELGPIDASWLDAATWLHVPLYGLVPERSREAITAAIDALPTTPRSLDLSSVSAMRELGVEALSEVLAGIRPDLVFANADEAALLREMGASAAGGVLIVKDGAYPVRIVTPDGTIEIPVPRIDAVVDSTGAGDAFAAGYLAAALDGSTPAECARAGIAIAARTLARPGAL